MAISKAYFEDASSNPVSSYNYGDDLAIRVRDFSLNLNSSLAETVQATVTNSANADSETFTLTETATNDGIFELKNIKTSTDQPSVSGNSKIEITTGENSFTLSYINLYDSNDTAGSVSTMNVPATSVVSFVLPAILPETGADGANGADQTKQLLIFSILSSIIMAVTFVISKRKVGANKGSR